MSNFFQDLDLSGNHIDVLLVSNFTFLQDLDCYFLVSDRVNAHHHFSKRAFSKLLLNKKMRDLFDPVRLSLFTGCRTTWLWSDPKDVIFKLVFLFL